MFFFLFRALTRFEAREREGAEVWKEEKAAIRDPKEKHSIRDIVKVSALVCHTLPYRDSFVHEV